MNCRCSCIFRERYIALGKFRQALVELLHASVAVSAGAGLKARQGNTCLRISTGQRKVQHAELVEDHHQLQRTGARCHRCGRLPWAHAGDVM